MQNLNREEFEILTYFEKYRNMQLPLENICNELNISFDLLENTIKDLVDKHLLLEDDNCYSINDNGLEAIEPYRVKKAFILGAGFGSRMVPVTLHMPKPLVKVKDKRIIETLLDALVEKGIEDITIVCGYKKECFDILLEKYPFIKLVSNDEYDSTNSISSLEKVINDIGDCYICEADFYISNADVIHKYNYCTNYLGSYTKETDDWCLDLDNGYVKNYRKGGKDCYRAYCISYWSKEDAEILKKDILNQCSLEDGKDIFWEAVALNLCHDHYKIEIAECNQEDIVEIDSFDELVEIDESYRTYKSESEV